MTRRSEPRGAKKARVALAASAKPPPQNSIVTDRPKESAVLNTQPIKMTPNDELFIGPEYWQRAITQLPPGDSDDEPVVPTPLDELDTLPSGALQLVADPGQTQPAAMFAETRVNGPDEMMTKVVDKGGKGKVSTYVIRAHVGQRGRPEDNLPVVFIRLYYNTDLEGFVVGITPALVSKYGVGVKVPLYVIDQKRHVAELTPIMDLKPNATKNWFPGFPGVAFFTVRYAPIKEGDHEWLENLKKVWKLKDFHMVNRTVALADQPDDDKGTMEVKSLRDTRRDIKAPALPVPADDTLPIEPTVTVDDADVDSSAPNLDGDTGLRNIGAGNTVQRYIPSGAGAPVKSSHVHAVIVAIVIVILLTLGLIVFRMGKSSVQAPPLNQVPLNVQPRLVPSAPAPSPSDPCSGVEAKDLRQCLRDHLPQQ